MFHYLTYEGSVEIDKINDTLQKNAIEMQVNEYGQTPKQLFNKPHPKRFSGKINEIILHEEMEKIKLIHESEKLIEDNDNLNSGETNKIENLSNEVPLENIQEFVREADFNFVRNYTSLLKFHKKSNFLILEKLLPPFFNLMESV